MLGVAGVLGTYVAINKYFSSKEKQIAKVNRKELISFLTSIRSFVDAMYSITSPFGRSSDPERTPDEPYIRYVQRLRETRERAFEEQIHEFLSLKSKVDIYFNKEVSELYNDVLMEWNNIRISLNMWVTSIENASTSPDVHEYWSGAQLSQEKYNSLKGKIEQLVRIVNPNYEKSLNEIDFDL